jgi:16S rRNA (adenine1518-N6/adenine1519-N6)-dimethyltransferase
MNLLDETKLLSKKYNILPSRQKGQNFLINEDILDIIIKASDLKKSDEVLEIGPGFGILTQELAKKAGRVLAVELDKKLAEFLRIQFKKSKDIKIIEKDILDLEISDLPILRPVIGEASEGRGSKSYKLIANLPYNITSAVLRKFLENEYKPELIVVMVQKEVAERICAKAGEMSLLSVSVQFYALPEIVEIVSKENFWPKPEIDSAILRLRPRNYAELRGTTRNFSEDFFQIVRIGFSSRRKQLQNNLANGLKIKNQKIKEILEELKMDPLIRPQDLSISDWIKLVEVLKSPNPLYQGGTKSA